MKKIVIITFAGLLLFAQLIPYIVNGQNIDSAPLVEREIFQLPNKVPSDGSMRKSFYDPRIGYGTVQAWFNFTYNICRGKLNMTFWKEYWHPPSFDLICKFIIITVNDDQNRTYYRTSIPSQDVTDGLVQDDYLFCNNWSGEVWLRLPNWYCAYSTIVIDIYGNYE